MDSSVYVRGVDHAGMPVQRWRWGLATAVVAVLGAALTLFLGAGGLPPETTLNNGLITSTTVAAAPTTSASTATSSGPTTTSEEQRLAEVELILQELWFGWFDAIYRKDPDALWQVVATTRFHDAGLTAMETMDFVSEPNVNQTHIQGLELLLDRSDCLVVVYSLDVSGFRGPGSETSGVDVMWSDETVGWRLATSWAHPDDLWAMDCESEREITP